MKCKPSISGNLPGGRIEVVSADDASDIRLRLLKDDDKTYAFYYHFRATGVKGQACTYRFLNAHEGVSNRLPGRGDDQHCWNGPGAMASYDLVDWFRVPAVYADGVYSFSHTPEHDICFYASWPPYSLERHNAVVARAQMSSRVRVSNLGQSVQGIDLDMLTIGEDSVDKRKCWVIARQHPSETMSSFFVEGLIERLLDEHDGAVQDLLRKAVFHIVPMMNPDGVRLALTRNNAAGMNLNRAWLQPDPVKSPEVYYVRQAMERIGVDFCLDCHGDRELNCNFLGGPLEIPSRSERLGNLFVAFERAWAAVTPEYERGHPYPGGAPAEADLSMAWNWIAERFNCLSMLLEQPFKDTSWYREPVRGWSPQRALRFGASLPAALRGVVERLR